MSRGVCVHEGVRDVKRFCGDGLTTCKALCVQHLRHVSPIPKFKKVWQISSRLGVGMTSNVYLE